MAKGYKRILKGYAKGYAKGYGQNSANRLTGREGNKN